MISTTEMENTIMFVNEISLHCFVVVMCLATNVEATIDMAPVTFGKISAPRCNASKLVMLFADDDVWSLFYCGLLLLLACVVVAVNEKIRL